MKKHLLLQTKLGISFAALAIFILALLTSGNAWAEDSKCIEILVLHSYHDGYVWTGHLEEGMKETFKKSHLNIKRYVEYMDTKRFQDPEHYRLFKEFLQHKLKKYNLDFVIVSDNNALSFALKHRNDLYPGLPIVFCGVNDFQESMLNGQHKITGVAETQSLGATLSIALRLHPGTHEIMVISGNQLTSDRAFRRQLLAVLPEFKNRVRITLWDDLPMTELADRLRHLSKGQIVLLNGEIRDEMGKPLGLIERAQFLRHYCHVPLYSSWEHVLGTGILGGKLISAHEQGRMAAELALRVLGGEDPDDIPVITDDSNKFMFDYQEMKRFDLSMDNIPPGSKVINLPSSFYSIAKEYVWTGLVVTGFLSMIAIILFVNIRQRQRAEGAIQKAHDELEIRVVERTDELTKTNEQLRKEISERKQAEEELRESEEKYRTLYDSTRDAIMMLTIEEGYLGGNPAAVEMFGFRDDEEFISQTPADLSPEYQPDGTLSSEKARQMMAIGMEKGSHFFEWTHKRLDGREFPATVLLTRMELEGRSILQATVRDITRSKQMEEELLKAKKLESLGILAGGIAHDFNNMMTVVFGNISLAQMNTKPGSKVFELLAKAEKESMRAKELTARLITFSKGGKPFKEEISIEEFVKESVNSLLSSSDIDCEFYIPDDLSRVEIDERQMKQVIQNIVINAREAMSGKGTIKTYCENVTVEEKDALTLRKGKYVKISIKDQGAGITKKNFQKIFDPYFSTKKMGTQKGMGLGLAVCHSIVEKHDGLIAVETEVGVGTTFIIYLPSTF